MSPRRQITQLQDQLASLRNEPEQAPAASTIDVEKFARVYHERVGERGGAEQMRKFWGLDSDAGDDAQALRREGAPSGIPSAERRHVIQTGATLPTALEARPRG